MPGLVVDQVSGAMLSSRDSWAKPWWRASMVAPKISRIFRLWSSMVRAESCRLLGAGRDAAGLVVDQHVPHRLAVAGEGKHPGALLTAAPPGP